MSFPTEEAVFALIEKLFAKVFPPLGIPCPADVPADDLRRGDGAVRDRPAGHAVRARAEMRPNFEELGIQRFAVPSKVERSRVCAFPVARSFSRKRLDDIEKRRAAAGVEWFFWVKTAPAGAGIPIQEILRRRIDCAHARPRFGAGERSRPSRRRKAKSVFDLPRRPAPPDRPRGEADPRGRATTSSG